MASDQKIVPLWKKCFACSARKALTEFHRSSTEADGRQRECKVCARSRRNERYFAETVNKYGLEKAQRLAAIREQKKTIPAGSKLCARCVLPKTLNQFDPQKSTSDGRAAYCRPCRRAWKKENSAKSPERRLAVALATAKTSAKHKGISNILTLGDLVLLWNIQEGRCYYTGIPMLYDGSGRPECVSIDRVDSARGYTHDNIVLCCAHVNEMKNSLSVPEMLQWCALVLEHSKDQIRTGEMTHVYDV